MDRPGRQPGTKANANAGAFRNSRTAKSRGIDRLQDAVYREMYLVEVRKPGAEMGLALALLRAVAASQESADRQDVRNWLKDLCPLVLKTIEEALDGYCGCLKSRQ
jgi:hypothetical protein